MALTNSHKQLIRTYLGYPDNFRYLNSSLESALLNLSPEAEAYAITCLSALAAIEAKLLDTTVSSAGVKKVDEIEFFEGKASSDLLDLGRMYAARLSIVTGAELYSDVFGVSGSLGGGGGNVIRLG